jgi:uridine kinase
LHSSALLPVFAYTIWVAIPDREGAADVASDPSQAAYQHTAAPRVRATANVNNSDPEHPRRTFADSC